MAKPRKALWLSPENVDTFVMCTIKGSPGIDGYTEFDKNDSCTRPQLRAKMADYDMSGAELKALGEGSPNSSAIE
uniref:Uncharacterized protein n=1 Tax=Globodera rostochiensis TaxID=31243 RepID=A0A914I090_GLORO